MGEREEGSRIITGKPAGTRERKALAIIQTNHICIE